MNISDFNKCSNCGACYNICPHDAILVKEDSLFYTPIIDATKCVNCGVCARVCPTNNHRELKKPIKAYAGWNKIKDIVLSSSSGGVFYGISHNVLRNNGVVFGAIYSEDNKEVIFASSDNVKINKFQKSKYVESKVLDVFNSVKKELENNRDVLICATPCQIAGLKSFLGYEHEKLITCDFVCGGLPSHRLYQEYLEGLEKRYKSKIRKVDFRPKTHGWKRYAILVEFENGKKYNVLGVEDPFLRSFLYGKYIVRDYCLECEFSKAHQSDITIADFWLYKKYSQLINDNGISLLVINSEKGKRMVENLKQEYVFEQIELKSALYNHKECVTTEDEKCRHDEFLRLASEQGLASAYNCFFKDSLRVKLKHIVARKIFKR